MFLLLWLFPPEIDLLPRLLVSKIQDEVKVLQLCQSKVRAKKLPMQVIDAEYQWYVFCYCALPRFLLVPQGSMQTNFLFRGGKKKPNGTWITSESYDKTIRIWDAATSDSILTLEIGSGVYSIAILPDGMKLVAGCYDNKIYMYSCDSVVSYYLQASLCRTTGLDQQQIYSGTMNHKTWQTTRVILHSLSWAI